MLASSTSASGAAASWLWHAPTPTIGGKSRDRHIVAAALAEWRVDRIVVPLARWAGELSAHVWCDEWQRLTVADTDPAVRAVWAVANDGRLTHAEAWARARWTALLAEHAHKPPDSTLTRREKSCGLGRVSGPWCALRRAEHELFTRAIAGSLNTLDVLEHAALAIAIGAGANQGGWRRNTKGACNFPFSPSYDADFLPRRIANLTGAARWATGRIDEIAIDWTAALVSACALVDRRRRIALTIDPPYGEERGEVYGRGWSTDDTRALARSVKALVADGAHAIVWCGPDAVETWLGLCSVAEFDARASGGVVRAAGLIWRRRETKTLIKAERRDADGNVVEQARYGTGGLIGMTPCAAASVAI